MAYYNTLSIFNTKVELVRKMHPSLLPQPPPFLPQHLTEALDQVFIVQVVILGLRIEFFERLAQHALTGNGLHGGMALGLDRFKMADPPETM